MSPTGTTLPFQSILEALRDNSKPFPPIYLHQFSDLSPEDLEKLRLDWPKIASQRKSNLLGDLEELAEADSVVCFDEVARLGLNDPEASVKVRAINMLWESEDKTLVPIFLELMEKDPNTEVRAAATSALGKYVYLGETDEIPAETLQNVEDALLLLATSNEPTLIRCRALESLGFSHREDVAGLIESAFSSKEKDWLTSALYAMGRSADKHWEKQVISMLSNDDEEIRYEAVRAAGELELKSAREKLLDDLREGIDDFDLRMATIWSLSQLGGEGVREQIEELMENCQEDEECQYLEEALENLSFTEDFNLSNLFDFDMDEDEDDQRS